MDPTTWNTYHLMANRAKALCIQRQQEQWKSETEKNINLLSSSTAAQLKSIGHLEEGWTHSHRHAHTHFLSLCTVFYFNHSGPLTTWADSLLGSLGHRTLSTLAGDTMNHLKQGQVGPNTSTWRSQLSTAMHACVLFSLLDSNPCSPCPECHP